MNIFKTAKIDEANLLRKLQWIDFNDYIHCDNESTILHHLDLDYSSDALILKREHHPSINKFKSLPYDLNNRETMDNYIAKIRQYYYTAGIRIRKASFHDEYGISSITIRTSINNGNSQAHNYTEIDHILDEKVDFIYYAYLDKDDFLPFCYILDCKKINDRTMYSDFTHKTNKDNNSFMSLKATSTHLIRKFSI